MTKLDDRKKAVDASMARESTVSFQVEARACKLFGLRVAAQLGIDGDEAKVYAMDVVTANLEEPGFDDVYRKVRPDLDAKGIDYSEHLLEALMAECLDEARKQLGEEA